jgi:hypothetical protein
MRSALEKYFEFQRLGTNWRTEALAGATTFATMAYIIFVNPSILSETGMPFQAVVAATCFCAAFGSILMGAVARYPIALAPGMGLNAYFTYTVVKGTGVPWEAALGAVFFSGVAFLVLTLVGVRQLIVEAIPTELYGAVAAGIGLFIAVIGLKNAGIIVAHPATLVALGNLRDKNTALGAGRADRDGGFDGLGRSRGDADRDPGDDACGRAAGRGEVVARRRITSRIFWRPRGNWICARPGISDFSKLFSCSCLSTCSTTWERWWGSGRRRGCSTRPGRFRG